MFHVLSSSSGSDLFVCLTNCAVSAQNKDLFEGPERPGYLYLGVFLSTVCLKFIVLMLDSAHCMVFNQEVKFKELQNPSQRQASCNTELQIQVYVW